MHKMKQPVGYSSDRNLEIIDRENGHHLLAFKDNQFACGWAGLVSACLLDACSIPRDNASNDLRKTLSALWFVRVSLFRTQPPNSLKAC